MDHQTEFDRYASNYDELLRDPVRDRFVQDPGFYHRRKWVLLQDFFRRHRLPMDKMAWLDVGCGKGELLGYGRSAFARVAGCDPSQDMIRDEREIEVRLQDQPPVLPFPDASFDFATAVCVYHHVEEGNRVPLTREVHRVLKPKGIFCMIEHNPYNPVTQVIVKRSPIDVDAHLLTSRSARKYAIASGMRRMETRYFLCLPEALYDRMGRLEDFAGKIPLGGQYAMFAGK